MTQSNLISGMFSQPLKNIIWLNKPMLLLGLLLVPICALADNIKLTSLKVPTAKKVKIPKSFQINEVALKAKDKHRFKDANYGASVSYQATDLPELNITYYVYPIGHEELSAEHYVPYEFHLMNQQLSQVYEPKGFQVADLSSEVVQLGDKKTLYSKHTFVQEGASLISETYLTNRGLHYVKLRVSMPSHLAPELMTTVRELAGIIINQTVVTEHKDTKLQVTISGYEDHESLNELTVEYQLIYSIAILSMLNKENMILGFDDIKEAVMKTTLIKSEVDAANEPQKSGLPTGFFTINDIVGAGYINEFIWGALRQPHWNEPPDLKMERFKTWLTTEQLTDLVPFYGPELVQVQYDD